MDSVKIQNFVESLEEEVDNVSVKLRDDDTVEIVINDDLSTLPSEVRSLTPENMKIEPVDALAPKMYFIKES